MARRSSTINKTRLKEDIVLLKKWTICLEEEVAGLDPKHNERHKMRLQSILGAGVLMDLRTAAEKVNSAFRAVRTIKREIT